MKKLRLMAAVTAVVLAISSVSVFAAPTTSSQNSSSSAVSRPIKQ